MKNWKYVIYLGGIARIASGELEFRRLDNDQWTPCEEQEMIWKVEEDGVMVTEKEALEAHEVFKKQASQL